MDQTLETPAATAPQSIAVDIYDQVYHLRGTDHAYMPIEVHAVSRADFDKWVVEKVGPNPAEKPKLLTMTWDEAQARTKLAQAGQ